MTTYRDMDILLGEAQDYIKEMLEDFELQLQGDRINYIRGKQWSTSQDTEIPGTPLQTESAQMLGSSTGEMLE